MVVGRGVPGRTSAAITFGRRGTLVGYNASSAYIRLSLAPWNSMSDVAVWMDLLNVVRSKLLI